MSYLLNIESKLRLKVGVVSLLLAIISFVIMHYYDIGFLGGFVSGMLLGIGLGLIITHKKTNED